MGEELAIFSYFLIISDLKTLKVQSKFQKITFKHLKIEF